MNWKMKPYKSELDGPSILIVIGFALLVIVLTLSLSGCASYNTTRTAADGTHYQTRATLFLVFGKASSLSSDTSDGGFHRKVGAKEVETDPRGDQLEAIMRAAISASLSAVGP